MLCVWVFLVAPAPAHADSFELLTRTPAPVWEVGVLPRDVAVTPEGNVWVVNAPRSRIVLFSPEGIELTSFGADGRYFAPEAIALAPDGSVYVVDSSECSVRHFSAAGELLSVWDTVPPPYSLNRTQGIALGADGSVYVTDAAARCIYKFNAAGVQVDTFGHNTDPRNTEALWMNPVGVTVAANGEIMVADNYYKRVVVFSPDGRLLRWFRVLDPASGVEKNPTGIAVEPSGSLVLSTYGAVWRFSPTGVFLGAVYTRTDQNDRGLDVAADGTIFLPQSYAVWSFAPDGEVVIRDTATEALFTSPNGLSVSPAGVVRVVEDSMIVRSVTQSGGVGDATALPGSNFGTGRYRHGITHRPDGRLVVGAWNDTRVHFYSTENMRIASWDGYWNVSGVGYDSVGNLYLADSYNRKVHKYDANGAYVKSWRSVADSVVNYLFAQSLAVSPYDQIYVVQQSTFQCAPTIRRYNTQGTFLGEFGSKGSGPGQFSFTIGQVAVDPTGRVYVADQGGGRIQWFGPDGAFLGQWGGRTDDPFVAPAGIAFDADGDLWVADASRNTVEQFRVKPTYVAPVAKAETYDLAQGVAKIQPAPGVLANDSDADTPNAALRAQLVTGTTNGRLALSADGSFTYTPDVHFVGTDTFTYRVSDGGRYSSAVTCTLRVKAAPTVYVEVAGGSRIETAIKASQRAFPAGAGTVVVCAAFNWPDSMGGAALAGASNGPVLLSAADALSRESFEEIVRLSPEKIYILGGEGAVSRRVEATLRTMFARQRTVVRIGGADRYETSRMAAEETNAQLVANNRRADKALLASGATFPDALAASPLAASKGWPVVLVPERGGASDTAACLSRIGVRQAVALGGQSAVSESFLARLRAFDIATERVSGSNRYATSVAVAEYGVSSGLSFDGVCVTSGENYPDALAGGVLAAKNGSVMLLTPRVSLDPNAKSALERNARTIGRVYYLGGTSALATGTRQQVAAVLR